MLIDLLKADKIYICCGYTDMRKQIDGLATIVTQKFQLDVYSNSIFLFCGRKCDRCKILVWEQDGFLLCYKRLSDGRFKWPRNEAEAKLISPQQLRWLLEGLEIVQPKAIKAGKKGSFC